MKYSNIQLCTDRFSDRKGGHPNHPAVRINLGLTIMGDSSMRRIKLTRGKYAIVDDSDFDWLNQWKWCALKAPNKYYAVRMCGVRMHREIMGLKKGDGTEVDHRNGKGLDNRRENLRVCSRSENMQNLRKYQGVCMGVSCQKWLAYITKNGKQINIGRYLTRKEAGIAYDKKAIELFGPEAKTNFPQRRPK